MSKFDERLKILMSEHKLSTTKLREVVGISTTQLGRYLSGHYMPTLNNTIKLCTFFDCSLDYILGIDDAKNKYKEFNEINFENFISRYNELLIENNTNHTRISNTLQFNRNNLVYWKKNKSLPTLDILYNLALALGTKVEYLVGRTNSRD